MESSRKRPQTRCCYASYIFVSGTVQVVTLKKVASTKSKYE